MQGAAIVGAGGIDFASPQRLKRDQRVCKLTKKKGQEVHNEQVRRFERDFIGCYDRWVDVANKKPISH